jgi:hypothetical protein
VGNLVTGLPVHIASIQPKPEHPVVFPVYDIAAFVVNSQFPIPPDLKKPVGAGTPFGVNQNVVPFVG